MAFFTLTEVRQAAARSTGLSLFEEEAVVARTERLFEEKSAEAQRISAKHFDIFLSHAYSDKIIISGLYSILTASGFTVYLDWIHDRHRLTRNNVSAANAEILRERMHQCKALFYVTTKNHSTSKWMPWECGYFDGFDSKAVGSSIQAGHVAILPVMQSASSTFSGQEYLGLYPTAQKGNLPQRDINIHNQNNPRRYFYFDRWVKNGHP